MNLEHAPGAKPLVCIGLKTPSHYISCRIDSPFENLFSSLVLLVKSQFSYVWPKDLNELYINLLKFLTSPSLKPKQFSGIARVSGFNSEWHENFHGFHKTTCGFLWNPKAKITEFGDQQASKIRVRTKYFLTRCTQATNLRGLGTPAGMVGSLKGSPKFLFRRPTSRSGCFN